MIIKKLIVYSLKVNSILKEYKFVDCGLNIILGEKKEEHSEANTVGKTTMIESIKYLLGSSIPEDFKNKSILEEKDILLVLQVHVDEELYLARKINNPDKGYILKSKSITLDLLKWDELNDKDYKTQMQNLILGDGSEIPKFSALREYIIRDEKFGFNDITLAKRNALLTHMYLAFLCNLEFNSEYKIFNVKKQEKELVQKLNIINSIASEIEDLKIRENILSKEISDLEGIVKTLNIPKKIDSDAENYLNIKAELNKVMSKIFQCEHIKSQYQKNIDDLLMKMEEVKQLGDIKSFYEQLLGYFPDQVSKDYTKAQEFYNFMVGNRGKYFSDKIESINLELKELHKQKIDLQEKLNQSTKIIETEELLIDLTNIMNEVNKKNSELAEIRVKIDLHSKKSEINAKINKNKKDVLRLTEIGNDTFNSQVDNVKKIKEIFNKLMLESYNEIGYIELEYENRTGKKNCTGRIKVICKIPDEKSHGRWYMKINMFDLSWFLNRVQSGSNINFLIHDGSYCKPDKDKKAKLLKYVDSKLKSLQRGQYIITVNEDELYEEDLKHFKQNKTVIAELDRKNENKNRFFGFKYN